MALAHVDVSSEDNGLLEKMWTQFRRCLFGNPCHCKMNTTHARISSYGFCFTYMLKPQLNNERLCFKRYLPHFVLIFGNSKYVSKALSYQFSVTRHS
jgi:hypothetical protein